MCDFILIILNNAFFSPFSIKKSNIFLSAFLIDHNAKNKAKNLLFYFNLLIFYKFKNQFLAIALFKEN